MSYSQPIIQRRIFKSCIELRNVVGGELWSRRYSSFTLYMMINGTISSPGSDVNVFSRFNAVRETAGDSRGWLTSLMEWDAAVPFGTIPWRPLPSVS